MQRLTTILLLLLAVSLLPMMATAQAQKTKTYVPVDGYFTPTDFPCLTETVHLTGGYTEQVVSALNANIAHFTIHQQTEISAVGVDSGSKYVFQGPMTSTAIFEEPYHDLPLEFTTHNTNHLVGPGGVNFFTHEIMRGMWDPETGALRLWIDKINVVCK